MERFKLCWKCEQAKPVFEFGVDRSRYDGLNPRCKPCLRNALAESAKRHPETAQRKWQKRYARDKEKIQQRMKTQRDKRRTEGSYISRTEKRCSGCQTVKPIDNFRKHAGCADGYYGVCQSCLAEYRKTIEYKAQNKTNKHRRRARERNAEGFHTAEDIKSLYKKQEGKCAYCEVDLNNVFHVDHVVPLSRGGTNWAKNLQVLCASCNLRKSVKLPHEFSRLASRNHSG